jgi:hypothetical protein
MPINQTNPIIVCGIARSGTTFARDLLHAHPDIAMSDEFFLYKIPSIIPMFTELATAFETLHSRGDWNERKAQIMRMLWFYTSQSQRMEEGMNARRFGNKTPGAEHYIEFYDSIFDANSPLYVYLLRQGEKVFLSRYNVDWGNIPPIRGQLKRYLNSISVIEAYQEVHPDRVYILQLDRITPTFEARLEETQKLLAFLGEHLVDEMLPFISTWKPVQTTAQVRRKDPQSTIRELPQEDKRVLYSNDEYNRYMAKYGYI